MAGPWRIEFLEQRLLMTAAPAAPQPLAEAFVGTLAITRSTHSAKSIETGGKARSIAIALNLVITSQSQDGTLTGSLSAGDLGNFTFSGRHHNSALTLDFQGNGTGVLTTHLSNGRLKLTGSMIDHAPTGKVTGHVTLSAIGSGGNNSRNVTTTSGGSTSRNVSSTTGSSIPVANPPTIIGGGFTSNSNTGGTLSSGGTSSNGSSGAGGTNSNSSSSTSSSGSSGNATGGLGFASTLSGTGVARGLPGIGGTVTGVEGGTNGVDTSVTGTTSGITGLASGLNGTSTGTTSTPTTLSGTTQAVTTTNNTVVSSTTPTSNVNTPGTVPGQIIFPTPTAPVVIVGRIGSLVG